MVLQAVLRLPWYSVSGRTGANLKAWTEKKQPSERPWRPGLPLNCAFTVNNYRTAHFETMRFPLPKKDRRLLNNGAKLAKVHASLLLAVEAMWLTLA